jgi:hypothetical protein
MVHSKLSLVKRVRPGEIFAGGTYKTRREFFDFVVDGRSLFEELVKSRGTDNVSVIRLEKTAVESSILAAETLMLLHPPDSPSSRRSLYVCAECGDLGCGAVTAWVDRTSNHFTWGSFVLENTYEDSPVAEYDQVGPFAFEAGDYELTLKQAMGIIRALP